MDNFIWQLFTGALRGLGLALGAWLFIVGLVQWLTTAQPWGAAIGTSLGLGLMALAVFGVTRVREWLWRTT